MIEEHPERRSVLMFAYYFPPCVCWPTASMRAEGLATGLTQEGWDPIVVTRGSGCPCLESGPTAPGTEASPQRGIEVRRVDVHPSLVERVWIAASRWRTQGRVGRVSYRLVKPIRKARGLTEHRNDWRSRALAEGKALLRDRDVQALWTTSGPYLSIGIGRRLQRRHGLTWVADLRDSITRERDWADRLSKVAGHHLRRRWYRDLKKASAIVGVSPQEAKIDSEALGVPVYPLPSGFDLEAWKSLRMADEQSLERGDRFRILYAGAFYGDRVELGGLVFRGLRRFVDAEDRTVARSRSSTSGGTADISSMRLRGKAARTSLEDSGDGVRCGCAADDDQGRPSPVAHPDVAGGWIARWQALRVPRGRPADPGRRTVQTPT